MCSFIVERFRDSNERPNPFTSHLSLVRRVPHCPPGVDTDHGQEQRGEGKAPLGKMKASGDHHNYRQRNITRTERNNNEIIERCGRGANSC